MVVVVVVGVSGVSVIVGVGGGLGFFVEIVVVVEGFVGGFTLRKMKCLYIE